MADQWQDNSTVSTVIKDDDEAPEDWEAALDEKPEEPVVKEASKESVKATSTTVKTKTSKKKNTNADESHKLIRQPDDNYTPEELDAIQKKGVIQKEQDKLDMVEDLVEESGEHHSLDNLNLLTREEFLNYSLRLYNRLEPLSKSEFYLEFLDHFLNGITKPMSIDSVKRLQATLQAAFIRKQSDEREKKAKAKSKKQSKPQLKTGRRTDYVAFGDEEDQDYDQEADYDDFM